MACIEKCDIEMERQIKISHILEKLKFSRQMQNIYNIEKDGGISKHKNAKELFVQCNLSKKFKHIS